MGSIEAANAALVHEYLTWMADTRDRAPSSVYDYGSRLQRLLTALGPTPLAAVTAEQIEDWLGRSRARTGDRKAAPATRAKELAIVRSLFRYLCARRHVEHDPSLLVFAPKVANIHPKPVPPELWAAVWAHPSLDDEARVVLGLGFFVGLRRSEMTKLSPLHVHAKTGRLVGFVRKGGGDDVTPYRDMTGVFADCHPHLLPDPAAFLEPLRRLVSARQGRPRLLPWRERSTPGAYNRRRHALGQHDIDPEWVNDYLDRWLRACGRPRAFTPHALRHSTATYLVQAGVPLHLVRSLMNHTSLNVTLRYVKVGGSELADWRASRATRDEATVLDLTKYQRHTG